MFVALEVISLQLPILPLLPTTATPIVYSAPSCKLEILYGDRVAVKFPFQYSDPVFLREMRYSFIPLAPWHKGFIQDTSNSSFSHFSPNDCTFPGVSKNKTKIKHIHNMIITKAFDTHQSSTPEDSLIVTELERAEENYKHSEI